MRSSFLTSVLLVPIFVTLSASSFAQNWPRFRGPSGSGISESHPLPTGWDATTGKGVVWKAPVAGVGHSSPVVWGDRVFISTAISSAPQAHYNPKDGGIDPSKDVAVHEWRVIALDKNTGKQLWSQTAHRGVPKVKRHVKATQANASPATDGRIVTVSFGSEGLYTYDMNGKLLWKQDVGILDPGYWGQPDLQWGFASSPIVHGNLVILQCDIQKNSFIVDLAAMTGKDRKSDVEGKRDQPRVK
jgi:outer membrane protein assembly factor BamB